MTLDTKKTLGKLSPDQVSQLNVLIDSFINIDALIVEMQSIPRFQRLMARPSVLFQWSFLYEMSFMEMTIAMINAMGEMQFISDAAKSDDPQQAVFDYIESYEPKDTQTKVRASKLLTIAALLIAIRNTIKAIEFYSISMNRLVELGAQGDEMSLIKAVTIDPTVLATPSIAKYVALASMAGNADYLTELYTAAANGPHESLEVHRKLRFITATLADAGAFEVAKRELIFNVLVNELSLYEGRKGDPMKALFRNINLWRKAQAT